VLEALTCDDFEPFVGQGFELVPPGGEPLEVVLSSAQRGAAPGDGNRVPFSLIFHAVPEPVVAQQICCLRHPDLGELELFVVPIGPDPNGMRYEIVFA
jgi:hypothetical protein